MQGRRITFGARALARALATMFTISATMLGASGTAHADATIAVAPATVAPGATITVQGTSWGPDPTLLLVPNGDIQATPVATKQLSLPNGGSFSVSWTAPSAPGTWGVCGTGTDLQGAGTAPCATFTVTTPSTTSATTPPTAAPTTLAVTTTEGSTTSTSVPESTLPLVAPPSTPEVTLPPTTVPPTLPAGVDGSATLDEPPSTAEGSGFSGMAIGGAVGIVLLAGIGVAGMLSSSVGQGPQPRGAIGVGVAGALLAGAVLVIAPPPKVNVPKLAITRVQVSQTLTRGSSAVTVEATCPAGARAIGGGFTSDWSSWTLDQLQPMVDWMEDPREGNAVLSRQNAASAEDPTRPDVSYYLWARQDGSVHFSDQVQQQSAYASWYTIERARIQNEANADPDSDPVPVDPVEDIAASPAKAAAQAHEYYRAVDTLSAGVNPKLRWVGLLVSRSTPTQRSWQVTASLAGNSLQSSATVNVVALCAPVSGERSPDGVPGVELRPQSTAANVELTALCQTDEVLTAIGWDSARTNGVTKAIATATNGAGYVPSGAGGTETVTAVCVKGPGVAGTSVNTETTVSGGFDGGATASCPSGYTATGGGMALALQSDKNGTLKIAQSVLGAAPVGNKGYGVQIRGLLRFQPENPAPGSALLSARNGDRFIPLTAYANSDRTSVTVQALCLKRVLS